MQISNGVIERSIFTQIINHLYAKLLPTSVSKINFNALSHFSLQLADKFSFSSAIMDTIFWDFLILYHIFFSPQVKRSVIISNKHGIYELPHELRKDLRLN